MVDTQFNKKPFVIIGAGGLGRELYSWISQSADFLRIFECTGFIDDDLTRLNGFNYDMKIIANLMNYDFLNCENVLLAISNPKVKQNIYNAASQSDVHIIGFRHGTTLVGLNTTFPPCLVTSPYVTISCDTKIGKGVFINNGSQIGHDVIIGDFVSIMANVDIGGNCTIGNNVIIGSGATILPGKSIPANTIVGAGSVVFRSIKECGTYVGNPAKKIF